jgi:hypothetical protein
MMIPETALEDRIRAHLIALAGHIGPRPTGSPGNQRAGAYLRFVARLLNALPV